MPDSNDKTVEIRHVRHIPADGRIEDTHLVKALVTEGDKQTPKLEVIKNYERSFYVTKKQFRNHKQHKEMEHLDKLNQYSSTQTNLKTAIAKALNKGWRKNSLQGLAESPYLYGSDQPSTSLLKHDLTSRYQQPATMTPLSVAGLDIEKDVNGDVDKINVMSVGMGTKVYVAILKELIAGISLPMDRLQVALTKYLKDEVGDGLTVEFAIFEDERDVIAKPISKLHEWQPDIVGVWWMNFDINHIAERGEALGMNIREMWCDPRLDKAYARYKFNKGPTKRTTASGVVKSLAGSEQWDTLFTSSSWITIDAMQTFRELRSQEANRSSFSLDSILREILGKRKLSFIEADLYSGLQWHQFMQAKYPIEYVIYNVFDTYGMVLLEKKTQDLSMKVPLGLGNTDFQYLTKRTKRTDNDFYFTILDQRYIAGTVPPSWSMEEERSLGLSGWILTLPSYMVLDNGVPCLLEFPGHKTNIKYFILDFDLVSSYPSIIKALNISKGTTSREVIRITSAGTRDWKYQNINAIHGPTNALMYCANMYSYPKPEELLTIVRAEKQLEEA